MFTYICKKLHFLHICNQNGNNCDVVQKASTSNLSRDLRRNLDSLRKILGTSSDIIMREFSFGNRCQIDGAVIYIDGLTNKATIDDSIIKPLMYDSRLIFKDTYSETENISNIKKTLLSVGNVGQTAYINQIIDGCLSGDTILMINGSIEALIISSRGWETRGVQEPKTESVVRGPREGFSETLRTNTALLRRKIKHPDFTLESMEIGERTRTNVCIAYIKNLVNPQLIEEIRRRLKRIKTDAILESGYIEQFIEDAPFSIFPTVANSEKPDSVAAKLLEGRAAILVDGTPFVLTAPMVFIESFQSSEDYYSRPYFASLLRILRFLSYFISILAPSIYVALTTFHQELIPTPLLFTMAAAHEGVPFPAVVEAGLMMIVFEILREAGVRLPRPVGQAISIVGALVIGDAAVSAGLIGAPMVIVVSITAVASFVVAAQTDTSAILRFTLLILTGVMGAYGIAVGLLGLCVHLASLRSFGTPYLSPIAPLSPRDLKDVFVRAPIWAMFTRPRSIGWKDPQRQEFALRPREQRDRDNEREEK